MFYLHVYFGYEELNTIMDFFITKEEFYNKKESYFNYLNTGYEFSYFSITLKEKGTGFFPGLTSEDDKIVEDLTNEFKEFCKNNEPTINKVGCNGPLESVLNHEI